MCARPADPLVSVVLPTYRRPTFLARAIHSVMDQSVQEWELIVVDDNDPTWPERQETANIMETFRTDGRVRYVRHDRNRGGAAARNTGIHAARGRFLAFLDDDDEWEVGKTASQIELFEADPDLGMAYTGHTRVFESGRPPLTVIPGDGSDALTRLMYDNFIGTTSSVMIPAHVLAEVGGFDPEFPAWQDYDLYVRVARAHRVAAVARSLVRSHRHGSGNIGRDTAAKLAAYDRFVQKYADLLDRHPGARRLQRRRLVTMLLRRGAHDEARRRAGSGLARDPFDLRLAALWAATLVPHRALRSVAGRGAPATTPTSTTGSDSTSQDDGARQRRSVGSE